MCSIIIPSAEKGCRLSQEAARGLVQGAEGLVEGQALLVHVLDVDDLALLCRQSRDGDHLCDIKK